MTLGGVYQLLSPGVLNESVSDDHVFTPLTANRSQSADVLQVIFYPHAKEPDIRSLLLELDAELLGSPSPNGVYRLVLPAGQRGSDVVARIGNHPAVQWSSVELKP